MEFISKDFAKALELILGVDGFEVERDYIVHKGKDVILSFDGQLYRVKIMGNNTGYFKLLDAIKQIQDYLS